MGKERSCKQYLYAAASKLDAEIDQLARSCRLYGLSPEEIEIVEGRK